MPFGYDCVICSQRYATRSERNEHIETHFVHKNCTDCNRLVILIGDIEFELHRPTHCISVDENQKIETNNYLDANISLREDTVISTIADVVDNPLKIGCQKEEHLEIEPQIPIEDASSLPVQENEVVKSTRRNTLRKRTRQKSTIPNEEIKTKPKSNRAKTKAKTQPKSPTTKSRTTKLLTCTQDGCEETFRQQLHLRKHLKKVHGIFEKHQCQICKFEFADKSNLKHHMVTHTDSKRFICSFCGARFHKLTNMTEHMNGHLGVKPYRCEICSKEFGRANHKRQHMRVHTGEKPYGYATVYLLLHL